MKDALVKNAADKEQVRKAQNKILNGRDQELADIRSVLGTLEGRRFLWRILEFAGLYKDSMTGSSMTFYQEGRRALGLRILAEITEADEKAYAEMMLENFKHVT